MSHLLHTTSYNSIMPHDPPIDEHARVEDKSEEADEDEATEETHKDLETEEIQMKMAAPPPFAAVKQEAGDHDTSELSEYERRRLEKIKRNEEMLARLGLGGKGKPTVIQRSSSLSATGASDALSKKKRKRESIDAGPRRVSRREKKEINYTEFAMVKKSMGVDDKILKEVGFKKPKTRDLDKIKRPDCMPIKDNISISDKAEKEYRRMARDKIRELRQAEKNIRRADFEYKHAGNQMRKYMMQRKMEETRVKMEELRKLVEEQNKINADYMRAQREAQMRKLEAEKEQKFRELEALRLQSAMTSSNERFKKAVKDSEKKMQTILLESIPEVREQVKERKREKLRQQRLSLKAAKAIESGKPQSPSKNDKEEVKVKTEDDYRGSDPNTENVKRLSKVSKKSEENKVKKVKYDDAPEETLFFHHKTEDDTKDTAKDVGGPISDVFSKKVQRDWLREKSHVPIHSIDHYIPQVGDTVLYFAMGHKNFLDKHPEIRCIKGRSIPRIAPFERRSDKGWKSKWEDSSLAKEGLLCTVTSTHAEFPIDPTTQMAPQKASPQKQRGRPPSSSKRKLTKARLSYEAFETETHILRKVPILLSVTLKPLVPVELNREKKEAVAPSKASSRIASTEKDVLDEPPKMKKGPKPSKQKNPPPFKFSVLMTPTADSNFIVPFTFAYFRRHNLKIGDHVQKKVRTGKWMKGVVRSFVPDERSKDPVFSQRVPYKEMVTLQELLGTTEVGEWPTLKGVEVEWKEGKKKGKGTVKENAWEITKIGSIEDPRLFQTIDESHRVSIIQELTDYTKSSDIVHWFLDPVEESVAPMYYAYVPLGMSISVILDRLSILPGGRCYYRSVDAILADLNEIFNSCILYNAPTADIVKVAEKIVSECEALLLKAAKGESVSKDAVGTSVKSKKKAVLEELKPADGQYVNSGWLQTIDPDHSWDPQNGPDSDRGNMSPFWIPQAGDRILYSRTAHEKFVAIHSGSLFYNQRSLAVINEKAGDADKEWLPGVVVDIRYSFPTSSESTFPEMLPLVEVTVKFYNVKKPVRLYWCPCNITENGYGTQKIIPPNFKQSLVVSVKSDVAVAEKVVTSCKCGNIPESFIKPVWTAMATDNDILNPKGLEASTVRKIVAGLEKLRQRCIEGKSIMDLRSSREEDVDGKGVVRAHDTRLANDRLKKCFFQSDLNTKYISNVATPLISIDFVLKRLKAGFYRQIEALQNDMTVGFVSHASFHLGKYAVALLLDSEDLSSDDSILDTKEKLGKIRKIYSIAMLCVNDPSIVLHAYEAEEAVSNAPVPVLIATETTGMAPPPPPILPFSMIGVGNMNQVMSILSSSDPCNYHRVLDRSDANPTVKIFIKLHGFTDAGTFVACDEGGIESPIDPTKPITIGPELYENDGSLVRALYGTNDRRGPCAKCQKSGKDMLHCRVRKGHSNPALESASPSKLQQVQQEEPSEEEKNALLMLRKAELVLRKSRVDLEKSQQNQNKVLHLSRFFMDTNFPFDDEDKRYINCMFCGYGGEMVCCESCPCVTHLVCADLKELPEGEWHCYHCKQDKKNMPASSADTKEEEKITNQVVDDKDKDLEMLLDELREYRLNDLSIMLSNTASQPNNSATQSLSNSTHNDTDAAGIQTSGHDLELLHYIETEEDNEDGSDGEASIESFKGYRLRRKSVEVTVSGATPRQKNMLEKKKQEQVEKVNKSVPQDVTHRKRRSSERYHTEPAKKRGRPRKYQPEDDSGTQILSRSDLTTADKKDSKVVKNVQKEAEWCPQGWTVTRKMRKGGATAGQWDKRWIDPKGKVFRQRKDVVAYLEQLKIEELLQHNERLNELQAQN